MPQMSKFTQALADDANKDKGVAAGLAVAGGSAVGVGMSRAKKKTNALKESILDRIDKGPTVRLAMANPTSLQGGIAEHLIAEQYKPAATAYQKDIGLVRGMQPVLATRKNRDARIEAQQKIVPMEEDAVVQQKRAADRRTAIRKGMGENMARTGKATPWTQPPKSWNFGGASSRFLKSIGYTGPLGLTTKRSSVTPEQPVAPKSSPKPKTELLANIKRNVARAELAPDVTPASSHLGRAEQFSKFSKQANSRGWKAGVRDAVKIGAKSPVGKSAIGATVLGTAVGGGMSIAKGLAADKVVTDAKKMAGVTTPTNSASNGTKVTPGAIDEKAASEWDTRLGAVSGRIKYDMAINRLDDPRAKAFALKYQKNNPHLFKR